MTDITPSTDSERRGQRSSPPLQEANGAHETGEEIPDRDQLIACAELFFFAYRDFTGDPDAILEK